MEKNIYELLNNVKTDVTQYEKTKLSTEEKERIKARVQKEVLNMRTKNKKGMYNKKWRIKTAAAACAAAVVVIGGGTVLAKGIFSDSIEKLIESVKGTKYEQEDTARYTKIGENIKSVDVSREENEYMTVAENNGLALSVSDAYCDGYNLYFTATLTGEKELFHDADWVCFNMTKETNQGSKFKLNGKEMWCGPEIFKKSSENTYVMMGSVELFKEQKDVKNGEVLVVEYGGDRLMGMDDDVNTMVLNEETGETENAMVVDVAGDWHLKFPVTVDTSSNQNVTINKEENGIVLKEVTKTPTGLVLKAALPDMTQEPYNDPYNDPYIDVVDQQGNSLQYLSSFSDYEGENGAGASEQTIIVLYSGEKNLHLKVQNKNVDNGILADIPFEVTSK